jgi:hypothetical protein
MCKFHLIVTCSKAKSLPVPEDLRVRSLRGAGSVRERAAQWIERLAGTPPGEQRAEDLYQGDAWRIARTLAGRVVAAGGKFHVVSAGYGLINPEALVCPYEATFTPGQPDSVTPAPGGGKVEDWWAVLTTWQGPQPGELRSLAKLARRTPKAKIFLVLSAPYLRALTPDLLEASRYLDTEDGLVLFSPGVPDRHPLADQVLPCEARLQSLVGGPLATLTIRLAARVLGELKPADWTRTRFRGLLQTWLRERPEALRPSRSPMTDEEVKNYIHAQLQTDPGASWRSLLSRLRAGNQACGMERFERIFRQVTSTAPGGAGA